MVETVKGGGGGTDVKTNNYEKDTKVKIWLFTELRPSLKIFVRKFNNNEYIVIIFSTD